MKLMIASDIHGSAYYLDLLLKCFDTEKPDFYIRTVKELETLILD